MLHQEEPKHTSLTPDCVRLSAGNTLWETKGVGQAYLSFAGADWYKKLNEELVMFSQITKTDNVLDVASGTGSATQAIGTVNTKGTTIGIEPSSEMLATANTNNTNSHISFMALSAEEIATLTLHKAGFVPDKILTFNAIHLFPDRIAFFNQAFQLLPNNGQLAFSTGFSDQALTRETGGKFVRAFCAIRKEAKSREFAEETQNFKPSDTAFELKVDDTVQVLEKLGFTEVEFSFKKVMITGNQIVQFFCLPGIIDTVLPKTIPDKDRVEIITEALQNIDSVERNWLLLKAKKQALG